MMKVLSCLFSVMILLLAGCASSGNKTESPATKIVPGVQVAEMELVKTGEAFFRQAVDALRSGDHEKFTEHYVREHKQQITKEIFEQMSVSFKMRHGKMKQLRYLGMINKYSGRILLWSVIFERTPAVNEQLKKAGEDPSKIPDTESLVQMMIAKTDQGWKVLRMGVQ